jgi:hypothetical protein
VLNVKASGIYNNQYFKIQWLLNVPKVQHSNKFYVLSVQRTCVFCEDLKQTEIVVVMTQT